MTGSNDPDLRIRFEHVGIAVEKLEPIVPILSLLGAETLVDERVEFLGARWLYYEIGDVGRVEVLQPIEDGTFLTEFIDRHGPGLHHITFEVANVDDYVEHLGANDVEVIDRTRRPHYREAFLSPRDTGGVLLQLIEFEEGYVEYAQPGVGERIFVGGERLSDR